MPVALGYPGVYVEEMVPLASSMSFTPPRFLQDIESRPGATGMSNSGQHERA